MPSLDSIEAPLFPQRGVPRPVHPSPTQTGLGLERMSPRELLTIGNRFGIDTPYYGTPLGWGEWAPVMPWEPALDVAILAPPLA